MWRAGARAVAAPTDANSVWRHDVVFGWSPAAYKGLGSVRPTIQNNPYHRYAV